MLSNALQFQNELAPIASSVFGSTTSVRLAQPSNVRFSICSMPVGTTIFFSAHHLNAPKPIAVTLAGSSMLVKALQLMNAIFPISLSVFGSTISVRLVQPSNVRFSICSMPVGTINFLSDEQPLNAPEPIAVTLEGRSMLVKALQL